MKQLAMMVLALVVLVQSGCGDSSPAKINDPQVECELQRPVSMAGLDWESNAFHTAIAGYIVEHGYGCKV